MIDDPLDLLRTHVRRQAATIEPSTAVDELIAHIIYEHDRMPSTTGVDSSAPWSVVVHDEAKPWTPRRRSRRWASLVVATCLLLGFGAGAVVTASIMNRAPVQHPEVGVVCHGSVANPIPVHVTDRGTDPLDACRTAWNEGHVPGAHGQAPDLVACIGKGGTLDVYPGTDPNAACTSLGLAVAVLDGLDSDPRAVLAERVAAINGQCLPQAAAQQAADALLEELGFDGWRTVLVSSHESCGLVAFGVGADTTLYVSTRPSSG